MAGYISRSEEETAAIAAGLAKTLRPGDVVALFGGMGMGKTVFARGLVQGLGLDGEQVSSPTFSLVNEYRAGSGTAVVCHFDMYRVEGEEALCSTGYWDYLDGGGILVVEWSENIPYALPESAVAVTIAPGDTETGRSITIECLSARQRRG